MKWTEKDYPNRIENAYFESMTKSVLPQTFAIIIYALRNVAPLLPDKRWRADAIEPEVLIPTQEKALKRGLERKMAGLEKFAQSQRLSDDDAKTFVHSTVMALNMFNKSNLDSMFEFKRLGKTRDMTGLGSYIDTAIKENVDLIKTIPKKVHEQIVDAVTWAIDNGEPKQALEANLLKLGAKSEGRARLIARDQTAKIYGQINSRRQQDNGIKAFRWITVGDNRVRDSHVEVADHVFMYSDYKEHTPNGCLPGEDIQCRCIAEPVFDDELSEMDVDPYEGQTEDVSENADVEKLRRFHTKNVTTAGDALSHVSNEMKNLIEHEIYVQVRDAPVVQRFLVLGGMRVAFTDKMRPGELGGTVLRDDRIRMRFNARYFATKDVLVNEEKKLADKMFGVVVRPEDLYRYTVTHEFGHVIEFSIYREYGVKPSVLHKQILDKFATMYPSENIKKYYSQYIHDDPGELFAEAYTDYRIGIVGKLGKAFEAVMKGYS
ncbi:hypothetical protein EQG49_12760 [Periweissella cryptocerci]|uniref:Phage head morphogenesis domain-containing protein n=1 Tax=Periweissella cryptocerci TaxID=2506420 RepID=A0A4P6YWV5_9LACO|nr:phage minor head protein [Periweissella cryptocerci]QBO37267.1 hypothetical protein EQG49_12760 [Periweissella cryptocerci]